jgi:O-antigen/teichoic acid export membrane protein
MEIKKRFARNSILYMLAMVIPNIAGFFMLPIYTMYIIPKQYGIFTYTTSIIGVMSVLSAMGLNAFYLRNYAVERDKKEINGTIFWSMVLWNIFLLIVSLLLMPFFLILVKAPFSFYPYMFLALLTQFFNSMEIIPMRTYRIKGEVNYYLVRILIKTILSVSLGLIFVVELKLGVLGRYYADLINASIFAIVFIVYMIRNSYFKINFQLLKSAVKFAIPIVPSDLVQMFTPMVINIIVVRTLSLAQLGIYSISITVAGVVQLVTSSIYMTVEPILYTQATKSDYPSFFKNLKSIVMLLVVIFCVGTGLFVKEAITLLLSERYWESWSIVQILCLSYIILVLKDLFNQLILVQGKTSMLLVSNLGYLIASILVSFICLPIWGEYALGWSNVIGLLVAFFIVYLKVDKSDYGNLRLSRDFVVMVSAIIIIYSSRLINDLSFIDDILIKIVLFILYSYIIMLVYEIHPKQFICEMLKKKTIKA